MLASVNFRVTLPLRAMVIFFINYVESTVFISIKSIAFSQNVLDLKGCMTTFTF